MHPLPSFLCTSIFLASRTHEWDSPEPLGGVAIMAGVVQDHEGGATGTLYVHLAIKQPGACCVLLNFHF